MEGIGRGRLLPVPLPKLDRIETFSTHARAASRERGLRLFPVALVQEPLHGFDRRHRRLADAAPPKDRNRPVKSCAAATQSAGSPMREELFRGPLQPSLP